MNLKHNDKLIIKQSTENLTLCIMLQLQCKFSSFMKSLKFSVSLWTVSIAVSRNHCSPIWNKLHLTFSHVRFWSKNWQYWLTLPYPHDSHIAAITGNDITVRDPPSPFTSSDDAPTDLGPDPVLHPMHPLIWIMKIAAQLHGWCFPPAHLLLLLQTRCMKTYNKNWQIKQLTNSDLETLSLKMIGKGFYRNWVKSSFKLFITTQTRVGSTNGWTISQNAENLKFYFSSISGNLRNLWRHHMAKFRWRWP